MKTPAKLLLLVLAIATNAIAGYNQPLVDIKTWQTTNKIPVYFVRAPQIPIVDIRVVFNAGSARDGERFGLAMLTNNLLNMGTSDLTADDIAKQFDQVGALYLNETGRDMALVGLRSLSQPEYLQPAVTTFAQVLTHPQFPGAQFNLLEQQTQQSILAQEQNPAAVALAQFYATIYGEHPYGHMPLGTKETVAKLTRGQVARFYQRYYVANNAALVIVGDLTIAQAKAISDTIVANLPSGEAAAALPDVTTHAATTQFIKFDSTQTHIVMGEPSVKRTDLDYNALQVGNFVLGGNPLGSLLANTIRNQRGLAYSIYSAIGGMQVEGPFLINLQTRTTQADAAQQLAFKEVQTFLHTGPDDAQVELAKQHLINGFARTIGNNSNIVQQLLLIAFYHLPLDYLETYRDTISRITTQAVKAALDKHLDSRQLSVVMVGQQQETAAAAS